MTGSRTYHQMFDLSGRRAVLTGGCGVLGPAFAEALAEMGATVAILDIDGARAERNATDLASLHGRTMLGVRCDVSEKDSVDFAVRRASDVLGGIDVLVSAAQASIADPQAYFSPFGEFTIDQWRARMAVDLDGMFLVAQAVGSQMVQQGVGGTMVLVGSIYGSMAPDQRIYEGAEFRGAPIGATAVYSAAKAGVAGLTRWLASWGADKGIRANTLVPGGVESGQNATFVNRYAGRVPMARMARREEVAAAMLWLASDASSYVTGQTIHVDGGLSAW
jgi:NAD(P)-dependent dehydrogenase (short-subunit alcohol dehydrogenase family)